MPLNLICFLIVVAILSVVIIVIAIFANEKSLTIEHSNNGMIKLDDIIFMGKSFMMDQKRFTLTFISKRGVNIIWTFYDELEREKLYQSLRKLLKPLLNDEK